MARAVSFTRKSWAELLELVRVFERSTAEARSPEKRQLRRLMRHLGYYASHFGIQNTTQADLQHLLKCGQIRLID